MSERKMIPIVDDYNVEEEPLYSKTYFFIKGYANGKELKNTLKALPLARKIHDGQHRKSTIKVNDKDVHLPYLLHVLKVCSYLISLELPLDNEELDILYSSALLHDALEDREDLFPKGGIELVIDYGFPKEVYTCVKLLSKHSGASETELSEYFNEIKKNRITLLIKLADRSHNVEDLYNMKIEKLHKYIAETRQFIYPLCAYGKQNYPELSNGLTLLKSKILSLTELTETLVGKYEMKLAEKDKEIEELKKALNKKS